MQALRSGRLNHAYLFSGPRGCGKTSSARILARSLNCDKGPTPEPCAECDSCRALAPDGPGSIDVIEIDAASHGGVDDARELRERAFFAPASSRFKIYIIDEAHMVSSAGFNALLKLVEEPPDYVKFVFATTEPEKVLGTIKSRTHHYPFRLMPPGVMRPYLEHLASLEDVAVEPQVLPLVVRAGGGSARDTLSVFDQLIAGSGDEGVTYARAVALLGVTDVALIDEMIDALAASDGAAAFATIDRVAEAGHDSRRVSSDLLQRLRDLIILRQLPDAVEKGLLDAPAEELARMRSQAGQIGEATLSRFADIVHNGLVEMRGSASPRLLLELVTARMLLPAVDESVSALLQRLERLEQGAPPATRASSSSVAPAGSGSGAAAARAAAAAAGSRSSGGHNAAARSVSPSEETGGAASDGPQGTAAGSGDTQESGTTSSDGPRYTAAGSGSGLRDAAAGPGGGLRDAAAGSGSGPRGAAAGSGGAASGGGPRDVAAGSGGTASGSGVAAAEGGAAGFDGVADEPAGDAEAGRGQSAARQAATNAARRAPSTPDGGGGQVKERPASAPAPRAAAADDDWPAIATAGAPRPAAPASGASASSASASGSGASGSGASGSGASGSGASGSGASGSGVAVANGVASAAAVSNGAASASAARPVSAPAGATSSGIDAQSVRRAWDEIVRMVGHKSKKAAAFAREAVVREIEGQTLVLVFKHKIHADGVTNDPALLLDAVHQTMGGVWHVRCEVGGDTRQAQPAASAPAARGKPAPVAEERMAPSRTQAAKTNRANEPDPQDDEVPYDPEFDGPPPSTVSLQGFDPGDEPDLDTDSLAVKQTSEQQALESLRKSFNIEKIAEQGR